MDWAPKVFMDGLLQGDRFRARAAAVCRRHAARADQAGFFGCFFLGGRFGVLSPIGAPPS